MGRGESVKLLLGRDQRPPAAVSDDELRRVTLKLRQSLQHGGGEEISLEEIQRLSSLNKSRHALKLVDVWLQLRAKRQQEESATEELEPTQEGDLAEREFLAEIWAARWPNLPQEFTHQYALEEVNSSKMGGQLVARYLEERIYALEEHLQESKVSGQGEEIFSHLIELLRQGWNKDPLHKSAREMAAQMIVQEQPSHDGWDREKTVWGGRGSIREYVTSLLADLDEAAGGGVFEDWKNWNYSRGGESVEKQAIHTAGEEMVIATAVQSLTFMRERLTYNVENVIARETWRASEINEVLQRWGVVREKDWFNMIRVHHTIPHRNIREYIDSSVQMNQEMNS